MLYEYALTIAANTPASAPETLAAPLAPGTIVRVDLQFPRGCVGLAHVQIWRSEHQVWPGNLDGSIAAEGLVVTWPEDYDLDDEPFALEIRGWNVDDSYAHTITCRFALLPLDVKEEARASAGLLQRIGTAIFGGS
ncbi:hypothetical protein LCGC14_0767970 [marine sediment metagenome]|uniref:Uncharacterized protein n=1 Tax=marine sediment metagenome TaxID=412755 RepID=A0A0F9SJ64_9ZZZZ